MRVRKLLTHTMLSPDKPEKTGLPGLSGFLWMSMILWDLG